MQFAPGFYTPLMFYQSDTLGFSEQFIGLLTLCAAIAGGIGALFEKLHLTFKSLVWLNAGTTLLALVAVPLLPALLVDRKEAEVAAP